MNLKLCSQVLLATHLEEPQKHGLLHTLRQCFRWIMLYPCRFAVSLNQLANILLQETRSLVELDTEDLTQFRSGRAGRCVPINVSRHVLVPVPAVPTYQKCFPIGLGPVRLICRYFLRVGRREKNGVPAKTIRSLASQNWLPVKHDCSIDVVSISMNSEFLKDV